MEVNPRLHLRSSDIGVIEDVTGDPRLLHRDQIFALHIRVRTIGVTTFETQVIMQGVHHDENVRVDEEAGTELTGKAFGERSDISVAVIAFMRQLKRRRPEDLCKDGFSE